MKIKVRKSWQLWGIWFGVLAILYFMGRNRYHMGYIPEFLAAVALLSFLLVLLFKIVHDRES